MCRESFPGTDCTPDPGKTTEGTMISKLLKLHVKTLHLPVAQRFYPHADLPSMVLAEFGDEGLAFLRECISHLTPFTSVSAQGVLDFMLNTPVPSARAHPVGGMSQFIDRMLQAAVGDGRSSSSPAGIARGEDFLWETYRTVMGV